MESHQSPGNQTLSPLEKESKGPFLRVVAPRRVCLFGHVVYADFAAVARTKSDRASSLDLSHSKGQRKSRFLCQRQPEGRLAKQVRYKRE